MWLVVVEGRKLLIEFGVTPYVVLEQATVVAKGLLMLLHYSAQIVLERETFGSESALFSLW